MNNRATYETDPSGNYPPDIADFPPRWVARQGLYGLKQKMRADFELIEYEHTQARKDWDAAKTDEKREAIVDNVNRLVGRAKQINQDFEELKAVKTDEKVPVRTIIVELDTIAHKWWADIRNREREGKKLKLAADDAFAELDLVKMTKARADIFIWRSRIEQQGQHLGDLEDIIKGSSDFAVGEKIGETS